MTPFQRSITVLSLVGQRKSHSKAWRSMPMHDVSSNVDLYGVIQSMGQVRQKYLEHLVGLRTPPPNKHLQLDS